MSNSSQGQINVTPLIDVLLVLLIIFMVMTPSKSVGLDALVPQQSTDTPTPKTPDRSVVIVIGKDLTMSINSEPTDANRLGDRLKEIFKFRAERVVFVKADPDTEFQHVAAVMDIAKSAGIDRVGLLGEKSR